MSTYVMKNGKRVRVCKYQCGTEIQWDTTNNYFVEPEHDNTKHTPERCKAFKEINQDPNKKNAVETMKQIENQNQTKNNVNEKSTMSEVINRLNEAITMLNEMSKKPEYIK